MSLSFSYIELNNRSTLQFNDMIEKQIVDEVNKLQLLNSDDELYINIHHFHKNISLTLNELEIIQILNKYFQASNFNLVAIREKQWNLSYYIFPYSTYIIHIRKRRIDFITII